MLQFGKGVLYMSQSKNDLNKILDEIKPEEKMKYEIASELGLLDKVLEDGWKSLSAKDTGRIGGIITKRKKQMRSEVSDKS